MVSLLTYFSPTRQTRILRGLRLPTHCDQKQWNGRPEAGILASTPKSGWRLCVGCMPDICWRSTGISIKYIVPSRFCRLLRSLQPDFLREAFRFESDAKVVTKMNFTGVLAALDCQGGSFDWSWEWQRLLQEREITVVTFAAPLVHPSDVQQSQDTARYFAFFWNWPWVLKYLEVCTAYSFAAPRLLHMWPEFICRSAFRQPSPLNPQDLELFVGVSSSWFKPRSEVDESRWRPQDEASFRWKTRTFSCRRPGFRALWLKSFPDAHLSCFFCPSKDRSTEGVTQKLWNNTMGCALACFPSFSRLWQAIHWAIIKCIYIYICVYVIYLFELLNIHLICMCIYLYIHEAGSTNLKGYGTGLFHRAPKSLSLHKMIACVSKHIVPHKVVWSQLRKYRRRTLTIGYIYIYMYIVELSLWVRLGTAVREGGFGGKDFGGGGALLDGHRSSGRNFPCNNLKRGCVVSS